MQRKLTCVESDFASSLSNADLCSSLVTLLVIILADPLVFPTLLGPLVVTIRDVGFAESTLMLSVSFKQKSINCYGISTFSRLICV